jgi:hypothetical protein
MSEESDPASGPTKRLRCIVIVLPNIPLCSLFVGGELSFSQAFMNVVIPAIKWAIPELVLSVTAFLSVGPAEKGKIIH